MGDTFSVPFILSCSARDHAFLSIYFAISAQLRREITKRQGHQFILYLSELGRGPPSSTPA